MTHAYESLVDGAMNLSLGVVIGVALGYFVVGLMNLSEKKANARVDRLKSVADTPHVSDDDYPPTDLDYPGPDDSSELDPEWVKALTDMYSDDDEDDNASELFVYLKMDSSAPETFDDLVKAYAKILCPEDYIDPAETVEITTADV
jgi:hypothetical protein